MYYVYRYEYFSQKMFTNSIKLSLQLRACVQNTIYGISGSTLIHSGKE